MLLRQITAADPVSALALRGLEETAPILQDAQFYARTGPADSVKRQREGATTEIFRSLNEDNDATPPTPTYDPVPKKIVSFDAKVDVVLEDRNEDTDAELVQQTLLEARDAGYLLQEAFIEGDVADDAKSFDGMRNMDLKQVTTPESAIVLPLGGDAQKQAQQDAIEKILRFFAAIPGGATHCYVNPFFKIRLLVIAKNLGYYRQSLDELGNQVDRIGDVVIRSAGYKKDGSVLLPFSETLGAHNATSSIFACRWGERVDLTVLTSVGVKGRYAGQVGNFIINNVNLDAVLHLQNPKALHQYKGWALEAA